MSKNVFPPMGVSGTFRLKPPFVAEEKVRYTVKAIRTFDDLARAKLEPVKLIYSPVELTKEAYEVDLKAGARIYTLTSLDGRTIHVPSTYILEYPNVNGSDHSWFHAIVSLGMLPNDYDTTRLEDAIKKAVSDYIGVESVVEIAVAETLDQVSDEQAILNQAAREAAITYHSTDYRDKLDLQKKLTAALQQVDDLTQMVSDLS